jgi:hypothetical protein
MVLGRLLLGPGRGSSYLPQVAAAASVCGQVEAGSGRHCVCCLCPGLALGLGWAGQHGCVGGRVCVWGGGGMGGEVAVVLVAQGWARKT